MRYFQAFVLLVVFIMFGGSGAEAQTSQELLKQMRSKVYEKVGGKEYYIHNVKRGQTLYMISKAYGVEVNDLIRENPQVREGLKADEKLRIPVVGPKPADAMEANQAAARQVDETPAVKPVDGGTTTKPKQEKVQVKGTRTGSTAPRPPVAPAKPVTPEPQAVKKDSVIAEELPCGKDHSTKKPVYKVALMIPLVLADVESLNAENPDPNILETEKSFQFLPFYEGLRMALDSLEKAGVKIRLFVYDVDKDTAKTKQILRKPEMKSMDLIFGLLYHRNFQIVAEFAKKNRIPLVNPISEKSELVNGNPWVFKVQPSKKSRIPEVGEYMSGAFKEGQILIVRSGKYPDHDAPDQLKKECQDRGLETRIVDGQDGAIAALSTAKLNHLVVFSEDAAYVFDLTRRLFELRNQYNMNLVGLPDWSTLDGLESEYLVALKTHMVSQSFIDYNDPSVKKFVGRYQEVYHADPALLAFQGYDIAFYFLEALHTYGTAFQKCIDEFHPKSLQTRFDFRQAKGNGFENQHWMIFKYDNYSLVPVH